MKIHFFHTNDVHSHFEEYLQVATQLRRRRETALAAGETVFTLEIGDHADRKRMETEGTFGRTNAALLKQMEYDAWTFGNNEGLTLPKGSWPDLVNMAEVPVLVANLFDMETREPIAEFEPYVIIERGGVRVAVLGLTVAFSDFYKMFGVHAEHPRETFARLLPEIKRQEVDLIVLMSHLGLNSDRQIAEELPEIDIIFGGHTHHVLREPERVGNTLICQAGCYGSHYGHLAVEWDEAAGKIVSYEGGAVPRDDSTPPDADLLHLLAHWQEHAAEQLTQVVAELDRPLEHALAGDSPLANVLTDGMRRLTGAPIAMINAGLISHGLIAGPVTRADLLTCFPGPSIPVVIELTGAQILSVLHKGLDPAYVERVGKGYGFRGHYVGGIQVSGLTVLVNVNEDDTYEVGAKLAGQPLDPEAIYEVCAVDYLYFSPVYEEFKQGHSTRFELPFLRELLGQELQRAGESDEALRYQYRETMR
ncbi:2',3'-cyclic-nucleotide 2'-phosphodiesterase (5'-nucleotidase family) [Tumebacillus sp. BK434]|uniref:bifunctional metallophosphatase/5'-nucleotidase n=1 Tax=Tumebacillus sp. BK434 TaxID=2512169 RepID=UPI001052BB4A|nr:bifunctional UDP-sugar hydrolase/5'-nucleotidase [Tumebacillus sp. BK434]TCP53812.1 2',3'-cyclic-nucleotide 2'-phosphodiesterase (5'-nucleotidase family) [Tumebacillus sp. BK434]